MIVLDTNVLSALMQREPEARVVEWLDRQPPESVWTTAVTVFEVRYGLARLAHGRRRRALERAFRELIDADLGGRVLMFGVDAAGLAGEIAAGREADGRSVDVRDAWIAGAVRQRRAVLATRNVQHFEGACEVVDPWAGGGKGRST